MLNTDEMTIDEAYNTCFGNPYIVPIDKHEEAKRIIRDVMEEVKQYRELGTVEELRIAKEKQIPKKLEYEADGYADGELVYDYAKCPICGHDFEYGINDWGSEYCSDCGQKLDWSDKE